MSGYWSAVERAARGGAGDARPRPQSRFEEDAFSIGEEFAAEERLAQRDAPADPSPSGPTPQAAPHTPPSPDRSAAAIAPMMQPAPTFPVASAPEQVVLSTPSPAAIEVRREETRIVAGIETPPAAPEIFPAPLGRTAELGAALPVVAGPAPSPEQPAAPPVRDELAQAPVEREPSASVIVSAQPAPRSEPPFTATATEPPAADPAEASQPAPVVIAIDRIEIRLEAPAPTPAAPPRPRPPPPLELQDFLLRRAR